MPGFIIPVNQLSPLQPVLSGALAMRCSPAATPSRRPRHAAFTLVEIMVVVTIISLLAAASVPALQSVKRRTIATTVANDLRTFAAAYEVYAHETGGWPAEVEAGVVPPEMASRINAVAWKRPTPFGGQYNWDYNQMHSGARYRGAIAISTTGTSAVIQDLDLLEQIDKLIDGTVNLSAGNFRVGADDEPVYIVSP
jgi:prepilin-type N-terminal cleavage/methylation domain-containing protein